jgi:hypothetical protein
LYIAIEGGETIMATLEVSWRNPNPVLAQRRRQTLERGSERALYSLQEFVFDEEGGYWMTISDLEVVAGGQAA